MPQLPEGAISLSPDRITALIRESMPLAPVPSVPEIRLHMATPGSGLSRLAEDRDFNSPYWAYCWGGGLALARHVLDHRETVAKRRVLDLGAGSGIVAIAAALSGAGSVSAADIDRYAATAIELNAKANGVTVSTITADILGGPPPEMDIVLIGDLFYEGALACRVAAFAERCLAANVEVLVGDPGRAHLPLQQLNFVAEYPGPDFGDKPGGGTSNKVFAVRQPR